MLMSDPLEAPISEHDSDQYQRYRELSMAAVVALALGVLSLFAFALPPLMILSIRAIGRPERAARHRAATQRIDWPRTCQDRGFDQFNYAGVVNCHYHVRLRNGSS